MGEGLLGSVKGVVDIVADPLATLEALNGIQKNPGKALSDIAGAVKDYVVDNFIEGSPEDHVRAVRTVTFNLLGIILGVGAAKAGKVSGAAKAGKNIKQTAKI